jgi:ATP-binding cassette, subfamily B, bacterial
MSSDTVDHGAAAENGLPPALSSMWRLCRLGYSYEPRMVLVVVLLTLVVGIPDALFALWLQLLGNAVTAQDTTTIWIVLGLMAVSATLTWLLTVVNARLTRRFRDRVTVALETHVATLQASVSGLEHQERSDYLDRLDVLRTQIFVLDHMYASVLNTLGWLVRLTITLALLASIHPALLLLAVFAVPTVVSSARRPAAERRVEERCAPHGRLAEHFFRLATGPEAGKEVRVTGLAPELVARRRQEWQRWFFPIARTRWVTAITLSAAWAVFALALCGRGGLCCRRSAGTGGIGSAHSGGGCSTLGLRGGDHRRDRLPARHLDGRCSPTGLAGGLRPFVHRHCRS